MNLAFCLFNYFPHGGLQRDFMRIARECINRGHSIHVYTMRWDADRETQLPVSILPSKGLQNITRMQHFAQAVKQQLEQTNYDLVIGFNKMPGLDIYYAADTCFQARARQQHGAWYRWTPRYKQLTAFESAVFAETKQTQILHLTERQKSDFMHFYQTPPERFHLLPPGIAKDRMAPNNASQIRETQRRLWQASEDDIILLLVGSGFRTKGLDRALTGLANLPSSLKNKTRLFVVGKDNPRAFQTQAQRLGILDRVQFLGGSDTIPQFLLAADLLLHPAYNESAGMVLLEAISAGLPVLTTDVCGYAPYVSAAKAGKVLPSPFNQSQLNQQLTAMLLSSERTQWKENGIQFAKKEDLYSMPIRAADMIESLRSSL